MELDGSGPVHGGGVAAAYIAFLLAQNWPQVVLVLLLFVVLPYCYFTFSGAFALARALTRALNELGDGWIREAASDFFDDVERLVPGFAYDAVDLNHSTVQRAYAAVAARKNIPKPFQRLLIGLLRRVDLPELMRLPPKSGGEKYTREDYLATLQDAVVRKTFEAAEASWTPLLVTTAAHLLLAVVPHLLG